VLQMKYRTRTYYTDGQKALMGERWNEGWTLHQIVGDLMTAADDPSTTLPCPGWAGRSRYPHR
jgi:hypothetical protein